MTYLAELEELLQPFESEFRNINLVVFDVDGVLTDGQLRYQADGETQKVFHVRDGVGLKLLQDMQIAVAVVTAKDSAMVSKRMSEMGIKHYIPGCKDKLSALTRLAAELSVPLEQCCFVGDDMVDLPAMNQCGLSISPVDAYPMVAEAAMVTLPVGGGKGVARWVCDLILYAQGQYDKAYQLASNAHFERNR